MRPVISYLIPSYNHSAYLLQLLESVRLDIALLDVPAEVIIIDDGSTDNSAAIAEAWVERNKNLHAMCLSQPNKGLASVLNRMIEQSSGIYLRLCASDDVIIAGSTKILYQHFESHPTLLCVLADAEVIDEKNNKLYESSIAFHGGHCKRLNNPTSRVKELIQHWCIAGPSHLIKKSHYKKMRYDESSKIDDFDLFLSLLEIPNSLLFIEDKVCLYRLHSSNTSKTKDRKKKIENMHFFLKIIEKYIAKQTLANYLFPLKYLSTAKINFLQKNYLKCFFYMCLFFKFKVNFKNN